MVIMSNLSQKTIDDSIVAKISDDKAAEYMSELPNWQIRDGRLFRRWDFKNFKEAKAFVDKVSDLAEQVNHHPDIKFSFKYAEIEIYTHKIGGLTESDFILAAKIDELV